MSNQEHEEYMKNVRWKTFGYIAFVAGGLLVSGTLGYASIKDGEKDLARDIVDLRKDVKSDIRTNSIGMKQYADSLHQEDKDQFNDIWNALNNKKILASHRVIRVNGDGCLI